MALTWAKSDIQIGSACTAFAVSGDGLGLVVGCLNGEVYSSVDAGATLSYRGVYGNTSNGVTLDISNDGSMFAVARVSGSDRVWTFANPGGAGSSIFTSDGNLGGVCVVNGGDDVYVKGNVTHGIYKYKISTSTLTQIHRTADDNGQSDLIMSFDGTVVLTNKALGDVRLSTNDTSWIEANYDRTDAFQSVAGSSDFSSILAGSFGYETAVYLKNYLDETWTKVLNLGSGLGYGVQVACSFSGTSFFAAPQSNAAGFYLSPNTGASWEHHNYPPGIYFVRVGVSNDFSMLFGVGSDGYVYMSSDYVPKVSYFETVSDTLHLSGDISASDKTLDRITVTDTLHLSGSIVQFLAVDYVTVSDMLHLSGDVFYRLPSLGVTYSTENKSVSTFTNMAFDMSCNFKGKTLFINDTGLYEYGGNTDNGDAITPSLKTDKSNKMPGQGGMYNSQHRKRIPTSKVYINAESSRGDIKLHVTQDDVAINPPYSENTAKKGLAVHSVKVGRGIDYVHLQLEVKNCDVIESIEFEPEEIRRRGK